jgi:hypothetical protein
MLGAAANTIFRIANKLSPVVDPQVSHFIQVPLAAMKSQ